MSFVVDEPIASLCCSRFSLLFVHLLLKAQRARASAAEVNFIGNA